ncbi:ABC transporter ATP-binding protein [Paractinoplanes brasiliensis]|uniref:NitT/TauT family transport system ATP-binding protein n=1 Tax=Paractinoplanes brasiliensis TaxID=52695 RepID=A0A4R6JLP8_9ACTN|nr:ABC transporter ATP-binding protein [Actinoplanes brasiliensis]TDO36622.1 NitT/TauT family transport system ATP-binding protein [Actinoplanes brasiliensis]GID32411.1 ABC transporter ATP-binding protein [Actinoplanes brasiliensis]
MPTSTDTDCVIRLDSLSMIYPTKSGGSVQALDDISLSVRAGEFISIVGPSGCGKSTLLRIIMGLSRQTSGQVTFGPSDDTHRNQLGMVFQQPLLLPWRTVRKNLMTSPDLHHARDAATHAKADELLVMLGLQEFGDRYPNELSGGMQQRVGIGRALMHDPRILLMDEPFGALDAMTRDQMGLDLLRIWDSDRKTVLFVTHSIPEAVLLADRVVVMTPRPGRLADVVEVGLPRPRRLENINTPAFGEIVLKIRKLLDSEHSAH